MILIKLKRRLEVIVGAALAGLLLAGAGCRGLPTKSERIERANLESLEGTFKAELPPIDANSTLAALLTHAMVNQPKVRAAYFDYAAAVQRITTERSLPDPRITLELDIQEVVAAVMPGIMLDVPWYKRLRIQGDMAAAESRARYHAFEAAVIEAAYNLKRPYYQLNFLQDRIRINRETLSLLGELEQIARAQTESGKATLQDALRAQIEQERLRTELENLEDSRGPLLAQFKGALGLGPSASDPPIPASFALTPLQETTVPPLETALLRNPSLRQMKAEVQLAEAGIRMANQSRLPDFSLGVEADVKASPTLWRPSIGATLPIWRDKIAAEISGAQARKKAAESRLTAEQIRLAVELADKSFMLREAERNMRLLGSSLLPKARQSLDVARSGYVSGRTEFINLLDAERSLLEFQLAEVDARTRRELALAELSLLIAGIQPAEAPVLPDLNADAKTLSSEQK